MDVLIRCRLCGSVGTEDQLLLPISEVLRSKIITLFQLSIGDENDRLSCCVCNGCTQTVDSTWLFYERIQKVQQELIDAITASKNLTASTCSQTEHALTTNSNILIISTVGNEDCAKDRKSKKQQDEEDLAMIFEQKEELDALSGASDCDLNDDGSIIMQRNIQGWEGYPWACCECGASILNYEELKEHYSGHIGSNIRFVCADCPKVYTKYTMFLSHVRVHRPYLKFCCDVCNKWFANAKQQETHRAEHTDDRPHACLTCGKRFRMASALLVHTQSHLPADLKNRHQCDECPKRFGTKPNLKAHKRIHAGVRDFTCDQCGKTFVQKGNLDNHKLTHTAARPFSCTTCGKCFKTVVRLKKHASVHSGLKPFQCDVCGRQFRERGTLKEHHRIHTGAMPFECEFCGKTFRFKGVLTTHLRQHTGERPYSCLECQHHFTNWPNYNKHMKRRHGINTSVTVRKPQTIPPTGMPQRNPPGSVLAPPQLPEPSHYTIADSQQQFYPVMNLYNLSENGANESGAIANLC